jgi:galactokinase
MGKHTDYAGGNSLVCSTDGRGMTMVSSLTPVGGCPQRKITIISILPHGMGHHATHTSAPFLVNGRTVVRHTINLTEDKYCIDKNDATAKDWRIYPITVVRRLEKNFGLYFADSTKEIGYHINIAISSNLPPASGLSTSSAFVTGLFLVLDSHLGIRLSETYRQAIGTEEGNSAYNLSTYLGNIENGTCYTRQMMTTLDNEEETILLEGTKQGDGVGTFGGSEDHAAILLGKKHAFRLLSFCPTRPASFAVNFLDGRPNVCNSEDCPETQDLNQVVSEFELPSNLVFVIAYSGARAEKAGQETDASVGYNDASMMAKNAFKAYITCSAAQADFDDVERKLQTLADSIRYEWKKQGIRRSSPSSGDQIKKSIASKILSGAKVEESRSLVERFEQFYDESELLVPAAAHCLANSDQLHLLGPIVDKSHTMAVNILRNQIAETAWLPLWARGIEHQFRTKPTLYVDDSTNQNVNETTKTPQRITAIAASAFGAGFGGSCWALVKRDEAEEFATQWRNAYDDTFSPKDDDLREFFITEPGPGALAIK